MVKREVLSYWKKKDDTLAVNNGLAAMPLHLSDDGQTLRISKNQYQKSR